jgi:hypothetical protein
MKNKVIWLGLSFLLVVAMLLASCGTSSTTSTTTTTSAVTVGATVLTVTEGSTVKTYSMADLEVLPSVSGNGGSMGKGGTITGPFAYQGVALTTLLNAVGGISAGETVTLASSDNYTQSLTYDQIMNGTLNYYDTTGNPVTPTTKPTLTIVYSENGAALDSAHGPTELGALSSQNILTDGSLWAKMVVKIDITAGTPSTTTMSMSTTTTAATTTTTAVTTTPTTTTTAAVVVAPPTTQVATTPVILTVVNGNSSKTYSLAQLQQLQAEFTQSGYVKGTAVGNFDSYVGVTLKTLLDAVGGFTASNSVSVADGTGYSKTFTYATVENGTGLTILDNTGATVASPQPAMPFLAYSKGGVVLDSTLGPLYLGFASNTSLNQYTQSSLWIKNVATVTIIAAQ